MDSEAHQFGVDYQCLVTVLNKNTNSLELVLRYFLFSSLARQGKNGIAVACQRVLINYVNISMV